MASGKALFLNAIPNIALFTVHKQVVRHAAPAMDIIDCQILAAGEHPLARDTSLIELDQPLLEFEIVVPLCDVNGTYPAVEATGTNQFWLYFHIYMSSVFKGNLLKITPSFPFVSNKLYGTWVNTGLTSRFKVI
jgi:hypothetical protein